MESLPPLPRKKKSILRQELPPLLTFALSMGVSAVLMTLGSVLLIGSSGRGGTSIAVIVLMFGGIVAALSVQVAKSAFLLNRFRKLGRPIGKTRREIVRAVGRPNRIHRQNGLEHTTWAARGYQVTLVFENGVCLAIESETAEV